MSTYTPLQKTFHWSMSLLIIILLIVGFTMGNFPKDLQANAYMLHKSFGFIVLCLVPIRLLLRFTNPKKPQNYNVHKIHSFLIKASVPILYSLMFIMPLSGFMMSNANGYTLNFFGFINIPALMPTMPALAHFAHNVHGWIAPIFVILIGSHIIAALFHHFYLKDNALKSMLPDSKK